MATVFIPPLLRDLTAGVTQVTADGQSVRQVIAALDARYPGIAARLRDGDKLAAGIAVAIDGVLASRGVLSPVGPNSEVHFLPAISGG